MPLGQAVAIQGFGVTFSWEVLLQHEFHRMVKLSDIQVYIIVIITGIYNLQEFWVSVFCFFFFFWLCFCTKESNIFCQTDIYLMKRRDT